MHYKYPFKGYNVFLKEADNDLNKSVEKLFDKTKRQVRKIHDKVVTRSIKTTVKTKKEEDENNRFLKEEEHLDRD